MSEQPGRKPEDAPSSPGSDGDGPEPGYTPPSQLPQQPGQPTAPLEPGVPAEETGADE
jgi:hypothetical protein